MVAQMVARCSEDSISNYLVYVQNSLLFCNGEDIFHQIARRHNQKTHSSGEVTCIRSVVCCLH